MKETMPSQEILQQMPMAPVLGKSGKKAIPGGKAEGSPRAVHLTVPGVHHDCSRKGAGSSSMSGRQTQTKAIAAGRPVGPSCERPKFRSAEIFILNAVFCPPCV